jgi:hypothetical protein
LGPLYNRAGAKRRNHLSMTTPVRQIVAFGGGGFSMESGNPLPLGNCVHYESGSLLAA